VWARMGGVLGCGRYTKRAGGGVVEVVGWAKSLTVCQGAATTPSRRCPGWTPSHSAPPFRPALPARRGRVEVHLPRRHAGPNWATPRPRADLAWANLEGGFVTHPVAHQLPNPWGLFDRLGNVRAWRADDDALVIHPCATEGLA
jgi:hypothetical protein